MGKSTEACRFLMGKPEGRRTLERLKPRWYVNIAIDHREVGWRVRLDQSGSL
jgi:hypothetical protein